MRLISQSKASLFAMIDSRHSASLDSFALGHDGSDFCETDGRADDPSRCGVVDESRESEANHREFGRKYPTQKSASHFCGADAQRQPVTVYAHALCRRESGIFDFYIIITFVLYVKTPFPLVNFFWLCFPQTISL